MPSKRQHINLLKQKIQNMQLQLQSLDPKEKQMPTKEPTTNPLPKQSQVTKHHPQGQIKAEEVQKWKHRKAQSPSSQHSKQSSAIGQSPRKQSMVDLLYQRFYKPSSHGPRSPSTRPLLSFISQQVDQKYYMASPATNQQKIQSDEHKTIERKHSSLSKIAKPTKRRNKIFKKDTSNARTKVQSSPLQSQRKKEVNDQELDIQSLSMLGLEGLTIKRKNIQQIFSGVVCTRASQKKHFTGYFLDIQNEVA